MRDSGRSPTSPTTTPRRGVGEVGMTGYPHPRGDMNVTAPWVMYEH